MIEVVLKDGRKGNLIDLQIRNDSNEQPIFLVKFEDGMNWFELNEMEDRY